MKASIAGTGHNTVVSKAAKTQHKRRETPVTRQHWQTKQTMHTKRNAALSAQRHPKRLTSTPRERNTHSPTPTDIHEQASMRTVYAPLARSLRRRRRANHAQADVAARRAHG